MQYPYDAVLVVAFGGPEGHDDVMPFLETVTRGRNVPRERLLEVAEHYYQFGGVSPLNGQVRELIGLLRAELDGRGLDVPIYWGNRNWHPFLTDTLQEMTADGVRRGLALVLAAYSSYSSCRQYRENIAAAREAAGPDAPPVDKIRVFYNHPEFVAANAERVSAALEEFAVERRDRAHVVYTAHSIPTAMAENSDYELQLTETCRLVSDDLGIPGDRWSLAYQSRSGPPQVPWLEPDILDHLRALKERGVQDVVIMPVGFLSDHMEVLFDLDEEARQTADELGMTMVRASTVGAHPRFIRLLGELIEERLTESPERRATGRFAPAPDVCPEGCCPAPVRRSRANAK